jgi:hypothetical protein
MIFGEGVGQGTPTGDPNVGSIVETYTITDGTGRFEGASGTFPLKRLVSRTGELPPARSKDISYFHRSNMVHNNNGRGNFMVVVGRIRPLSHLSKGYSSVFSNA